MRLDLAPGEAAALEQALVLGQFQPRLEGHSSDASAPRLSLAGRDQQTDDPATARLRRDRHARDMEGIAVQAPQHSCDKRATVEGPESATRGNFGGNRRAGFEKGRRWRSGLPVLRGEGGPDDFGCPGRIGVRQRANDHPRRRFRVIGDWIANLHGPTYKTVARAEGKGGVSPMSASFMDE